MDESERGDGREGVRQVRRRHVQRAWVADGDILFRNVCCCQRPDPSRPRGDGEFADKRRQMKSQKVRPLICQH